MNDRPVLRVVSGQASPEEIAAVVAAVAASAAATAEPEPHPDLGTTSIWARPGYAHRQIRATFTPSAHGWRTSFWPR